MKMPVQDLKRKLQLYWLHTEKSRIKKSHITGSGTNIITILSFTVIASRNCVPFFTLGLINEVMCSKSDNDIRVKFLTISSTNSYVVRPRHSSSG
jgi:hypothetical protein